MICAHTEEGYEGNRAVKLIISTTSHKLSADVSKYPSLDNECGSMYTCLGATGAYLAGSPICPSIEE